MSHVKHLTGKERILKVFKHEQPDHVPWVPFAGVHAGKLKGYTATEILQNGEKLLEVLLEVNRLYLPDGQPVLFDLQVEAEILGCKLRWADKAPPSVEAHPLQSTYDIPDKLPGKDEGRLPMILDVMRKLKDEVGETTALFGLVTGPLTLGSHLKSTSLFMDLIRKKDYCKQLFDYTAKIACKMADYYIETGIDVVAIVDPVISQISPKAFKGLLSDPFQKIFDHIKEKGAFSSFFVCGDATKNIEPMCKTSPDSIFVDENIDMVGAKQITDKHGIIIGGNIPLTSLMLYGTQQDNMKYVVDMLDTLSHDNLVVAPGCDLPYDVPPDNVIGVAQAIHEPDNIRVALENYQFIEEDIEVELPDYDNLEKPLVEVFTIDSAVCAACGYMKNMAMTARDKFGDDVDVVEYKWIEKENIARAKKLGVKHLPCILINGSMKYSSIIPNQNDYFKEIQKLLK